MPWLPVALEPLFASVAPIPGVPANPAPPAPATSDTASSVTAPAVTPDADRYMAYELPAALVLVPARPAADCSVSRWINNGAVAPDRLRPSWSCVAEFCESA